MSNNSFADKTQPEGTSQTPTGEPGSPGVRTAQDHHAGLWSGLVQRADALTTAVARGDDARGARAALLAFCRSDVLGHLKTEERVLYEAARRAGAEALIATLEIDHRFLMDLVEQIDAAGTDLEAALSARALVVLFALRIQKEDTVVLPVLTEAGVDVESILDRMVIAMASDHDPPRFTYL